MCNSICKSHQKEQQELEKKIQKKNADSIAKSVVGYLQDNHLKAAAQKQQRKQRKAVTSNYIITADQARDYQLAKQKREEKAANKKTKPPTKRKINFSQLSTQKNMEDRTCSNCDCSFSKSSFKNEWLSCEKCPDWFCKNCVEDDVLDEEFLCNRCE